MTIQEVINSGKRFRRSTGIDDGWSTYQELDDYLRGGKFDLSSLFATDWEIEPDPKPEYSPTQIVKWANVYPGGYSTVYETKEKADECASKDRVRCVKLVSVE